MRCTILFLLTLTACSSGAPDFSGDGGSGGGSLAEPGPKPPTCGEALLNPLRDVPNLPPASYSLYQDLLTCVCTLIPRPGNDGQLTYKCYLDPGSFFQGGGEVNETGTAGVCGLGLMTQSYLDECFTLEKLADCRCANNACHNDGKDCSQPGYCPPTTGECLPP